MSDDSKSRSPASKITDAQCLAAMRECAAQKGESHDAMWSQMDAQVRAELIGEWRAILECAGVSGQEPVTWGLLDVGSNPPRISGDIFDERNTKANESSGWRAVPLYLGAGRSPAEVPPNVREQVQLALRAAFNAGVSAGHPLTSGNAGERGYQEAREEGERAIYEVLAVWRSAQQ